MLFKRKLAIITFTLLFTHSPFPLTVIFRRYVYFIAEYSLSPLIRANNYFIYNNRREVLQKNYTMWNATILHLLSGT